MRKRNKFWSLSMALVLSGGISDDEIQQKISQTLQKNPEIFSQIINGFPDNFIQVAENLLYEEVAVL